MTASVPAPRGKSFWDDLRLVFPDTVTWRGLDAAARQGVIDRILGALAEYQELMSEGVRHVRSKVGIAAELDGHFRRAGRRVFVASELGVFYPGESVIVPDVLAVLDCDPDIEPDTWVVDDRGRGIDLVIEVRNQGKAHKDLVDAVRDYARRRIPEYFAFDCRRGQLRGWRLGSPNAQTYQPIMAQGGYLPSRVLGLDLAVVGTRLRFFANGAAVPDAAELLARIQSFADRQQGERDEAIRARDEALRVRDDARDQLGLAQAALCEGILALCAARNLPLSAQQQAQIVAEGEVTTLSLWLRRAATTSSAEALLASSPE
jgi:Uma2 family endonuclease